MNNFIVKCVILFSIVFAVATPHTKAAGTDSSVLAAGATPRPGLISGTQSKLSVDLIGQLQSSYAAQQSKVEVIVQYRQAPSTADSAQLIKLGAVERRALGVSRTRSVSLPAAALSTLAANSNISAITRNRRVRMLLDNSTAAVGAATAWAAGLDGSGIGVAVIDSGIAEHDDLQGAAGSRIVYRESFVDTDDPNLLGHGEHVAGILGGRGTDSGCDICTRHFVGLAPNVNILDLRVLDEDGEGSDDGVIAAINRAIQLKDQFNIRVINLSLGRPVVESYATDPLCQAVEAAWQAGIVVVAAAGNGGRDNPVGNNGYGTIMSPGNDPYVITVGAMKSMGTPDRGDDLIASYSSKGPTPVDHFVKPDLVAPGNLVVSLMTPGENLVAEFPQDQVSLSYYQQTAGTDLSTSYFTLSGTSMATPVVSGTAALLLQLHPDWTPDQVKARLMRTAYKIPLRSSTAVDGITGQVYTSQYDVFTVGAGYLDIASTLSDPTPPRRTARSPVAYFIPQFGWGGQSSTFIFCDTGTVCDNNFSWLGGRSPWATQSIWGEQSIWADQSIWGEQSIWADQSIWGEQSIWADQSIWGEQSPQATSTLDPDEGRKILVFGEQ